MEIEQTYESIHGMLNPLQAFPDSLLSGNIVIVLPKPWMVLCFKSGTAVAVLARLDYIECRFLG